jgi:hypothetical protein
MNPANVWFGYSPPKLGGAEWTGRDGDHAATYLDISGNVSNGVGVFDLRVLVRSDWSQAEQQTEKRKKL